MATCSVCGTRKGKRNCPALGAGICSQCCGKNLETGENCFYDCGYFIRHIDRITQSKVIKTDLDFLFELDTAVFEKTALESVLLSIEAALIRVHSEQGGISKSDVYDALEYVYEVGRVKLNLRSDLEEPLSDSARIITDAIEENLGWAAIADRNEILLRMKCIVNLGACLDKG